MNIRPATYADAAFLAKVIFIAGRAHVSKGIWEVILEGNEEECKCFLKQLTVTQIPHLFHYSVYLVAEEEGIGPIGSLGGYDPKRNGYQPLQQAIPEVFRKLNLPSQFAKVFEERASKILACIPGEIDGAWVIDSVATLPEHRGKGAAEHLLKAILNKGNKLGYSKAQVNMYIGNEPALNLYKKFGFEIREEIRDKYFEEHIGSLGMVCLVRDL